MKTLRATWMIVTLALFGRLAVAQEDLEFLRRVATHYQQLKSFEFAGHLTAIAPGTNIHVRIEALDAAADASFVPPGSNILRYGETHLYRIPSFHDENGRPVSPVNLKTKINMPPGWARYQWLAADIVTSKELPSQDLRFKRSAIRCRVFEVVYHQEAPRPPESTSTYWIDPQRLLILRQELVEAQEQDGNSSPWRWTYTVDSYKLNQPPPEWLVEAAKDQLGHPQERRDWIGRNAPDFALANLAGQPAQLSSKKGSVILLDFWATWCAPCREEMPTVEKLRGEFAQRGLIVWTISDENEATLSKWANQNPFHLTILRDSQRQVSDDFGVVGIPALILIDEDGKVRSYYVGPEPEESLRSAIEKTLGSSATQHQ